MDRCFVSFFFLAIVVVGVAANSDCDKYVAASPSATDSFCRNDACRNYCALTVNLASCMQTIYEDAYRFCKLGSGGSGATPTTTTSTTRPTTTTTTSNQLNKPEECVPYTKHCDRWTGVYGSEHLDDWCRSVACPGCASLSGGSHEVCLASLKEHCVVKIA